MKCIICVALICIAFITLAAAHPGKPRPNNFPRPTTQPRSIRVRRQEIQLEAGRNQLDGTQGRLDLSAGIGSKDTNVIASGFVGGATANDHAFRGSQLESKSGAAHGGQLEFNSHGLGASIGKESIPGQRDTITKSLNANLYSNNDHKLSANAFTSSNIQPNGFEYDRHGGGLKYEHVDGHKATLTASNIPGFGSQIEAAGKANLWTSSDKNTRLDFTAGGSKWLSGPFSGRSDFNTGFGLNHYWG